MSIDGFEQLDRNRFPPSIEMNGGLTLKLLTGEDAVAYHQLIDYDRDHLRQFGDNTADKYPNAKSIVKSIVNPESEDRVRYGVWNNGDMVARISIETIDESTAEIGYLVGKKYIGHGYAEKALRALCDYTFSAGMFSILEARIAVGNVASRKTVEKCGFIETEIRKILDPSGVERDYWIFKLSRKA